MKQNRYYFETAYESVSGGFLEVICYDLNNDIAVATIELKYTYDENSDEWQIFRAEFYTNPTIKEITELQDELLRRARDLFHEFCYACYTYSDFDDESNWFV